VRPFAALQALAPAKINLGLFVGPLRADRRHQLVSVMQSISLADRLTLEPAPDCQRDELVCPGVEGPASENLAMRALIAFRAATSWEAGAARVKIEKRVPLAAGLGGGSADAAALLRLVALASGFGERKLLQQLASGLGADVPAQVRPGRWLAEGAGERLTTLPEGSPPFGVLLLPAKERLPTASVYGELDRRGDIRSAAELASLATSLERHLAKGEQLPPKQLLANDLQRPALALCPSIAGALERAQRAGADISLLSGSGPTVLGFFEGVDGPGRARHAARQLVKEGVSALAATPVDTGYGEPSPVTQQ
jgi:4-diphosphocytidyl-2-C-methyl-D-erythritol kinase